MSPATNHRRGCRAAASPGTARPPAPLPHGRARARVAAALLVASLAAACGRGAPPAAAGWFPLEAGHAWTYEVVTERGDGAAVRERLTLRTDGRDSVEGLDGGPAYRRRSSAGMTYWLRADDSGIYRVASRSELDADPRPDEPRRYVLRAPYAAGTQWQAPTTAYLLQRRNEFPREIRHLHPSVPMGYTIEAVGETVQTRAGRFSPCLRVKGEARLRLFADPVQGWRDLPLTTTEWYCEGVGLVRVQRDEPAGSAFLTGGTLTLELIEWH